MRDSIRQRTRTGLMGAVVAAALVAAVAPAGTPAAQAAPLYPVLAGSNVISAQGTAAVTLRVPAAGHITRDDLNLVLGEGATAAHAAIVIHDCDRVLGSGRKALWCPEFQVTRIAEFTNIPQVEHVFVSSPPNLEPGLVDVYIVADGPVTLEVGVAGLAGALELTATGGAHGLIERLPKRCEPQWGDCTHRGFGGATHDVGEVGLTTVYAYAQTPTWLSPGSGITSIGTKTSIACVYWENSPSQEHPSSNPDDHPTGCHYDPLESSHSHSMFRNYWLTAAIAVGPSNGMWVSNSTVNGPVYAGWAGHQWAPNDGVTTDEPGHLGGWAAWLTRGIDCPTGDFFDCGVA